MSKLNRLGIVAGVLIFLTVPLAALAGPLESTMTAWLVKQDAKGKDVFEKTETAAPDEVIEYRMQYKNTGDTPISGLRVDGPIPANTHYIGKTAATKVKHDFVVSIDGGAKWEPEPVKRLRKQPDGTMKEVIVPPSEYTHVRWLAQEPIEKGKVQEYRYRVRIE